MVFEPEIADREIAERARREGRIILTRDTLLVRRRDVRDNCFLVRGDNYRDQLRQVVDHFAIDPKAGLFSRCVRCNEPLAEAVRRQVAGKVPPYVYATQEAFGSCASCGRIYWKATHWEQMEKHLKEILSL